MQLDLEEEEGVRGVQVLLQGEVDSAADVVADTIRVRGMLGQCAVEGEDGETGKK